MTHAAMTLSYAVRSHVLLYYLSRLSLVLGGLTLVPLVVALAQGEQSLAARLALAVLITALLWLSARRATAPRQVQTNEALVVVALAFVLAPLLMVPALSTGGIGFWDALFESVSAVTTTGLSSLETLHDRSTGYLFLRAWMQWYGGLGIAVFSVALVMGHHSGARRLGATVGPEGLPLSARTYARHVLAVYVVLSILALGALWLALGDGFQALVHALAAVSTGGFSSFDHSLADMTSTTGPYVAIGAGILGAVPLILYYQVARGGNRDLSGDPEWWTLILALAVAALAVTLALHYADGMDWRQALHHGGLLSASAQTTTGFSTLSIGALSDTSKLLLILSMFVGGSVGSTAGGIKLLRLLIMMKLILFMLRRTAMPSHAVVQMGLGGRNLEAEEIQRALVIIVFFALTVFLSWLVLVASGYPSLNALFEVTSAIGTVGLSTGIASHDLATGLKLMLCLDMLLGRLEILALLVVLYPPTWLGPRSDS